MTALEVFIVFLFLVSKKLKVVDKEKRWFILRALFAYREMGGLSGRYILSQDSCDRDPIFIIREPFTWVFLKTDHKSQFKKD